MYERSENQEFEEAMAEIQRRLRHSFPRLLPAQRAEQVAACRTLAKLLDPVLTEFKGHHGFVRALEIRFYPNDPCPEHGYLAASPDEIHLGLAKPDLEADVDDEVYFVHGFIEELLHNVQYEEGEEDSWMEREVAKKGTGRALRFMATGVLQTL